MEKKEKVLLPQLETLAGGIDWLLSFNDKISVKYVKELFDQYSNHDFSFQQIVDEVQKSSNIILNAFRSTLIIYKARQEFRGEPETEPEPEPNIFSAVVLPVLTGVLLPEMIKFIEAKNNRK